MRRVPGHLRIALAGPYGRERTQADWPLAMKRPQSIVWSPMIALSRAFPRIWSRRLDDGPGFAGLNYFDCGIAAIEPGIHAFN